MSQVPQRKRSLEIDSRMALWGTTAVSMAGYLLVRYAFPLVSEDRRIILADIRKFAPSMDAGLRYALWLIIAFLLCGAAYRLVRRMDRPPTIAAVLVIAVLFSLPLLTTYPINANDLFRYMIRGRVASVYQENPFVTPPDAFPQDPFLTLAGEWASETSPYGPIWEMAAGAITQLSGDGLYLNLLMFKGFGLFTHLAIAFMIWLLLEGLVDSERIAKTVLWCWNPALLLTFVVDAHNDGLMLLWFLLGIWLARRDRPILGFVLMFMAPLTKPIALLPMPFFFLMFWRAMPTLKARTRFVMLSGAGMALVAWLAFLPFGSPIYLMERLLREASVGGGFSLQALAILLAHHYEFKLSIRLLSQIALIAFGLAVLWLFWASWHGRRHPLRGAADIFYAYVLQAMSFRIWYTVWSFPWLILDTEEGESAESRLLFGTSLLLTSQLSVIIYGHLRVHYFHDQFLKPHLIGVPITFGLPLLLAAGWHQYRRRSLTAASG